MSTEIKQFNDMPIAEIQKNQIKDIKKDFEKIDTIKISTFAEKIAEFISTCETPMTIGLQGDWGTGKTSLMNMIKSYLSDKSYYKIDINTWHYSMFHQDQYLGLVVVNTLVNELSNLFKSNNSQLSELLKKAGSKLESFLRTSLRVGQEYSLPIGFKIKDVIDSLEIDKNNLEIENISGVMLSFRKQFSELIYENILAENKRIFFFIDDLDRIRPIKAIEVLETLKNFMDIEGCVFVLAVDYEIVQLGIAEKFGKDIQRTSGKSFFDKIIQLPFNMPTSSYDLETYISQLLINSKYYNYDFQRNQKSKEFFVNIAEVTLGRNPRSIKRAVNYASLLEKIRASNATNETKKNENTPKLLFAIVCLQIAWPELFEYFVLNPNPGTIRNLENWDFLDKLPQAKKLFNRINNTEDVQDNISAFFDILYEILDVNEKDGVITEDELSPLIDILKLVKLTSEKNINRSEDPLRKKFYNDFSLNSSKVLNVQDFFNTIFMNSYFATQDVVSYKKGGWGYITIVSNRRQIGSLVTLKTKPFIFRIKKSKDDVLHFFENSPDFTLASKIIRDLENANTITGIGDTEIDIKPLIEIQDKTKAIKILNQLFTIIIK